MNDIYKKYVISAVDIHQNETLEKQPFSAGTVFGVNAGAGCVPSLLEHDLINGMRNDILIPEQL